MTNVIPPDHIDLKEFAVLLDIDGTILNFAPTPREVWVPPSLRDTLQRLHARTEGAIAFVSGRSIDDMDLIFAPLEFPAIGGHGAEFRPTVGGDAAPSPLPPLAPAIKRRFAAVRDISPGVILEDKVHSLAVHFRLAPDKEAAVRRAVEAICASLPPDTVEVLPGKAVLEIKQAGFNKGTAVRELMTYPPFRGRRPIFIGDDTTDELVFPVLAEFNGIGFSVGRRVEGARGCFDAPRDVRNWLDTISREPAKGGLRADRRSAVGG